MGPWRSGRPAGPLSPLGITVMVTAVVVDQVTKLWAEAQLPIGDAVDLLPILTLYRVHNTGIAFSFLAGAGGGVLIALMLAISAVVIAFWTRADDGGRLAAIGFALIVGGAIGNLIDRIRYGYVIDFLLLHVGDLTLFVFNLADTALTLGPALLLIVYLFPPRTD